MTTQNMRRSVGPPGPPGSTDVSKGPKGSTGSTGRIGPIGPRGISGPTGTCSCDTSSKIHKRKTHRAYGRNSPRLYNIELF